MFSVMCMIDCKAGVGEKHLRLGTGGSARRTGQRCVPLRTLLLHSRGIDRTLHPGRGNYQS